MRFLQEANLKAIITSQCQNAIHPRAPTANTSPNANLIARLLQDFNAQRQIRQLGPPIPQIPDHILDDVWPVGEVVHHPGVRLDDGQHDQGRRQHAPQRKPRAVMPGAEIFRLANVEGTRDCFLDIAEHGVVGFSLFRCWRIAVDCDVDEGPVEPGFQF